MRTTPQCCSCRSKRGRLERFLVLTVLALRILLLLSVILRLIVTRS